MVSADTCQLARKVASLWGELIASLSFASEDRVVVVSLRGNEIPQLLSKSARERLVAFSPVTVTDLAAFTLSTGIQATPGTFALDEDLRIRWIILPNRLHEARGPLAAFSRRDED
jgi:poly-gamma-glutamate capsule biosynthesis protein CapA/YwtB (metallophosphatase superfamily)